MLDVEFLEAFPQVEFFGIISEVEGGLQGVGEPEGSALDGGYLLRGLGGTSYSSRYASWLIAPQ